MAEAVGEADGTARRALLRAGVVLGVGLGAFFDGIVFHQVLQFHHLLTSHPDPSVANDVALNTLADGLFHVGAYLLTVTGLVLLWRVDRRRIPAASRRLSGAVLAGWGGFNLAEGVVNHHLLGVHHVWPAGPGGALVWDAAFLAWGVVLVAAGIALSRRHAAHD